MSLIVRRLMARVGALAVQVSSVLGIAQQSTAITQQSTTITHS